MILEKREKIRRIFGCDLILVLAAVFHASCNHVQCRGQQPFMQRFELFEIADQNWCPAFVRRAVTDFLATVAARTGIYRPTVAVLKRALERSRNKKVVALCAGSGGGIVDAAKELPPGTGIVLTDLRPYAGFSSHSPTVIYDPRPIDATKIPADLDGARIIYSSFHHFSPRDARAILESAVRAGEPIAVFEGTERSLRGVAACLFIPLLVLVMMPFTRPVRILSLAFTYLVPLLPLIMLWDGTVSSLRSYTQSEMQSLTEDLSTFQWEIGVLSGPHREHVAYLLGMPNET